MKLNCGSDSLGNRSKVPSLLRLQSHYQHKGGFQNSCSLGPFLDLVLYNFKKITHISLGYFKRECNEKILVFGGVMGMLSTS